MVTLFNHNFDWLVFLVTCHIALRGIIAATQAEERSSQKVKLKIYDLSTSDWSTRKQTDFATIVANEATVYCTSHLSQCGLDSAATFLISNVGTSSPEGQGYSIEFTFYIEFPSGAAVSSGGVTSLVVPKAAAQAIAGKSRSAVRTNVGRYITYVDEEYYSIPPDTETNRVIIPIAIFTVVGIALTAATLHVKQKRDSRKKQLEERRERRKLRQSHGQGQKDPSYTHNNNIADDGGKGNGVNTSYNTLDNTNTTILTTGNTPRNSYNNNSSSNNHTPRHTRDKVSFINDGGSLNTSGEPTALKSKSYQRNSVNEFHDGYVEEEPEVVVKTTSLHNNSNNRNNNNMEVAKSLKEDEARRERKMRRKEKRKERKRREQEQQQQEEDGEGEGEHQHKHQHRRLVGVDVDVNESRGMDMETSYENPAFDSDFDHQQHPLDSRSMNNNNNIAELSVLAPAMENY